MKIKNYLSLVKFNHTLFALPFAIVGFFMAIGFYGFQFSILQFILVVLCMFFARNAAMAFNRIVDKSWDGINERTSRREIPQGIIKPQNALIFVIINMFAFWIATFFINTVCFLLSPVALGIILSYSYTKRFTFLCHFILGIGLGLAPIGAFIAVSGEFKLFPILIGIAVWAWVSGFDIIYALQDIDFDRQNKLFSIPAKFGAKGAFLISRVMHIISGLTIIATFFLYLNNSVFYSIAALVFNLLLIYQHSIISPNNMKRINFAFFNLNGVASVIFAVFAVLGFFF